MSFASETVVINLNMLMCLHTNVSVDLDFYLIISTDNSQKSKNYPYLRSLRSPSYY